MSVLTLEVFQSIIYVGRPGRTLARDWCIKEEAEFGTVALLLPMNYNQSKAIIPRLYTLAEFCSDII